MNAENPLVVIGMDPHKRTVTIEVMTSHEQVAGGGRFTTDAEGYAQMLAYARLWPQRLWAVEGCAGIGKHVASRLVADGEAVVHVPAKMSARVRVFATGQGRKTDATDAHSIALVGVRMGGLRPVVDDDQPEVLRMCVDRRASLGAEHTRKVCQLHKLLLELIPGGAKRSLSAAQAKELLKKVRPTTPVGKVRKAHATELAEDLATISARTKAADKGLKSLLKATGTGLIDLHGIGPSGAARLLVEVADITRFPDRNHFASWTGTAPVDASSGDHTHHRLSRKGNRQINRVLHIMAVVQLRHVTEAAPTTTATWRPTRRPWKRCDASNADSRIWSTRRCSTTSPGTRRRVREGNWVTTLTPARPAHNPMPALRTSHFPDPPPPSLEPPSQRRLDTEGCLRRRRGPRRAADLERGPRRAGQHRRWCDRRRRTPDLGPRFASGPSPHRGLARGVIQ
ncbi:IS110 family RNA-guided transposase [Ornithinimicrobium sediminis]|uniref:IS110 family transposase n=1 Tax=Ornithinimicrobium sediminis TaxID=2904603 RepID=UPI001E472796|nr:IS110 family transposase [Ornithinimicrobium sediminis]MCE0486544.1 IS110 family transposase [Ornithinimicrobium sediminis]